MINPYKNQLKLIEKEEKTILKQLERDKVNSKKLLFVKVANDKLKCKACGYLSNRRITCRHCGKVGLRRENPGTCNGCGTYITEIKCGRCGAFKDITLTKKITLKIKEVKSYYSLKKREIKKIITKFDREIKKQKKLARKRK